jgi:hypothetical protein
MYIYVDTTYYLVKETKAMALKGDVKGFSSPSFSSSQN